MKGEIEKGMQRERQRMRAISLWLIGEPIDRARSLDAAQSEQGKSGGVPLVVGSVLQLAATGLARERREERGRNGRVGVEIRRMMMG